MDEYDKLLKDINNQVREMSGLDNPLQLNKIKSGQEIQRKHIREEMGLSTSEGMTLTEENMKELFSELNKSEPVFGGIVSRDIFYKDFIHFSSYLINKYFTKE